jgi:hypothetical protein
MSLFNDMPFNSKPSAVSSPVNSFSRGSKKKQGWILDVIVW